MKQKVGQTQVINYLDGSGKMYIQSDFAGSQEPQQEDRRKKGSLAPWLIGGGLVAAGGIGLALASKGKAKPNAELVKKGADDAKELISSLKNKSTGRTLDPNERKAMKKFLDASKSSTKSGKLSQAEQSLGIPKATGYSGLSETQRKAKLSSRKNVIGLVDKNIEGEISAQLGKDRYNQAPTKTKKAIKSAASSLAARLLGKQQGVEYMKYTTTADFAMAGTLGGIKTGVLSRITGQLGSTVEKAKSWLQKTQQAKQAIGSATIAKQRLKPQPYVSPNAGTEAMARRKYGSVGVEVAPPLESTLGKPNRSLTNSKNLQSSAQLRNDLTAGSARQINRGSADRFSKAGSQASINDNRSLRVKYTKDPRTGKLVSAAYNKLSLLCDL